jgi:hypothetical protein
MWKSTNGEWKSKTQGSVSPFAFIASFFYLDWRRSRQQCRSYGGLVPFQRKIMSNQVFYCRHRNYQVYTTNPND